MTSTGVATVPKYVSMAVEPAARDALTRLSLAAGAAVGRRVTLSAALLAAVAVAERHVPELAAELAPAADPSTGEG
jgi:hypothetical protein